MTIFARIVVVVLALCLELALLQLGSEMLFGPGRGMVVEVSYGNSERQTAYRDFIEHPSPATKSAFYAEVRLMHEHEDWKGELALGIFMVINGVWIFYFFRRGHGKSMA